eukprot:COSAG03_NODE_24300_length_273_cov_0.856322_2_plen_58_part_01
MTDLLLTSQIADRPEILQPDDTGQQSGVGAIRPWADKERVRERERERERERARERARD